MSQPGVGLLTQFASRVSEYLPSFVAGLLIVLAGIVVGWIAKRAVIRILVWLRLDRLGGDSGWRAAFGKGDARAALYNGLGTVAMMLVVLLFLDNGLQVAGLVVLSRMIDTVVFSLPNLGLVALIVGVGFLLAGVVGQRVEDALEEEGFIRARLMGKFVRAVLQALVAALALWQLGIARQVVLGGFLIIFGSIGVAFALSVGIGSSKAVQRAWENLFEKKDEEERR